MLDRFPLIASSPPEALTKPAPHGLARSAWTVPEPMIVPPPTIAMPLASISEPPSSLTVLAPMVCAWLIVSAPALPISTVCVASNRSILLAEVTAPPSFRFEDSAIESVVPLRIVLAMSSVPPAAVIVPFPEIAPPVTLPNPLSTPELPMPPVAARLAPDRLMLPALLIVVRPPTVAVVVAPISASVCALMPSPTTSVPALNVPPEINSTVPVRFAMPVTFTVPVAATAEIAGAGDRQRVGVERGRFLTAIDPDDRSVAPLEVRVPMAASMRRLQRSACRR